MHELLDELHLQFASLVVMIKFDPGLDCVALLIDELLHRSIFQLEISNGFTWAAVGRDLR